MSNQIFRTIINLDIIYCLLDKICDSNAIAYKTQNPFNVVRGEDMAIILNNIINK